MHACRNIHLNRLVSIFGKIQEIQDDNEDEGEDDLIELTTCGITTQWLFPDNCRQCPVGNCRQHFRTKSDGIKHYKKLHAFGSICCPGIKCI